MFVFQHEEIIDNLIKKSNIKSIFKLLDHILNIKQRDNSLQKSFKYLKHRFNHFFKIFKLTLKNHPNCEQLIELFLNLIDEESGVVDKDYFIDNILLEVTNISKIINQIKLNYSKNLMKLIHLILKKVVFQKNDKKPELKIEGNQGSGKLNFLLGKSSDSNEDKG